MTAFEAALLDVLADNRNEMVRLRESIEVLASALIPLASESSEAPEPCLHPHELRTDFGVTDGQPDWACRCGHQSRTVEGSHAIQAHVS
tara:strand:+ start:6113 stop:6379 length:267 start_codon:yes stop_codon:yes gene_type:complete